MPSDPQVSDKETIAAMLSGGLKVCDYAIKQWSSGVYTKHLDGPDDHEERKSNFEKFSAMKRRMRELAAILKEHTNG